MRRAVRSRNPCANSAKSLFITTALPFVQSRTVHLGAELAQAGDEPQELGQKPVTVQVPAMVLVQGWVETVDLGQVL